MTRRRHTTRTRIAFTPADDRLIPLVVGDHADWFGAYPNDKAERLAAMEADWQDPQARAYAWELYHAMKADGRLVDRTAPWAAEQFSEGNTP